MGRTFYSNILLNGKTLELTGICQLSDCYFKHWKWLPIIVTVHEPIGHNAQKCANTVFWQHHSSGTTMSSELFLGVAVIEG